MKKFIIILLVVILCGCEKKEVTTVVDAPKEDVIVSKLNDLNDYVYFEEYKNFMLDGLNNYILKIPIINLNSNSVASVNMEIKSFIISSYNDYEVNNGVFIKGKYISYDYFISDKYISLLIKYNMYYKGNMDEDNYIIYNINISTGENLDNKALLKEFVIDENELSYYVRQKLDSEDIEYSVMSMKNGYNLYLDKDGKLHLLFMELSDDEQIKRDLIIS